MKSFFEMYLDDLPKSLYAVFLCTVVGLIIQKFMEPTEIQRKEISVVCFRKDVQEMKLS